MPRSRLCGCLSSAAVESVVDSAATAGQQEGCLGWWLRLPDIANSSNASPRLVLPLSTCPTTPTLTLRVRRSAIASLWCGKGLLHGGGGDSRLEESKCAFQRFYDLFGLQYDFFEHLSSSVGVVGEIAALRASVLFYACNEQLRCKR